MILRAQNLSCSRTPPCSAPSRFENVTVGFERCSVNLLLGKEGCGKNLFLRVLGLLEEPDAGDLLFGRVSTRGLSEQARLAVRNQSFGFVFSDPFLLPTFSVVENIAMPLFKVVAANTDEARARIRTLLDFVGLPEAAPGTVDQLSLFEHHCVALARALVNRPEILFVENADEHLAGEDLCQWMDLIRRAVVEFGATAVVTLENESLIKAGDRVLRIANGVIDSDSATNAPLRN